MATAFNTGGIRPVTPPTIPPYVAFFAEPATAQSRFLIQGYVDREEIATAVEALVELLDTIDGDPDENDTNDAEDDFAFTGLANAYRDDGPGCPIADAGGQCDEDEINTNVGVKLGEHGPGCILADPDEGVDDKGCDPDEGV